MSRPDATIQTTGTHLRVAGRLVAVVLFLVLAAALFIQARPRRDRPGAGDAVLREAGHVLEQGAALRAHLPSSFLVGLDSSALGDAVRRLTQGAFDRWRAGAITSRGLLLRCGGAVLLLAGSVTVLAVGLGGGLRALVSLMARGRLRRALREVPTPFDLIWYPSAPPVGRRGGRARQVPLPALAPIPLGRVPRNIRREHGISPLGRRLLQIYCAAPETPPDVQGVRGTQTLLGHVLDTCQRARQLAPTYGIDEWLAEALVLAHDVGKVFVFQRHSETGAWSRSGELHSRAGARILWRIPEFRRLPNRIGEPLRMVAKYHHDPDNIPLDLRPEDDASGTLTQRLLALLRLTDQQSTHHAKTVVAPDAKEAARQHLPEAIRAAFERHNVNQHRADEHYEGFLFADGLLVLPEAEFRERVIDELRAGDPGLAVELGSAHRRRRGTTHKALALIADRFREAGALIEEPEGVSGSSLLWNVRVGRKTWNACLLLEARRLTDDPGLIDDSALARWGAAPFEREILGPTRIGSAAPSAEAVEHAAFERRDEAESQAPLSEAGPPPEPEPPPKAQTADSVDVPPIPGAGTTPESPYVPCAPAPEGDRAFVVALSDPVKRIITARSQALGLSAETHARNLLIREVAAAAARFLKQPELRSRLRTVSLVDTAGHVSDAEIEPLVTALAAREQIHPRAWMVRTLDRALGVRR